MQSDQKTQKTQKTQETQKTQRTEEESSSNKKFVKAVSYRISDFYCGVFNNGYYFLFGVPSPHLMDHYDCVCFVLFLLGLRL